MAFPRPYGRYILEDRLAMGGMAEIFRARTATAGFEKRVCIKRVLPHYLEDEDFVTMFRDEAKTAAKLQHANVVQVFDFGEVDDDGAVSLFLAMELVEGCDLRKAGEASRKKKIPFELGEVVQIGIDVCRGLHHAHSLQENGKPLGVVHRDISPHNILLSRGGEVKITDFGIAKAAERATHTSTGIVKGKVAYMSPEQAEGKPFDHRLDQWALGVVLWELLCGERLFRGENDATILRKVLNVEVPEPTSLRADCPSGLEEIILRALQGAPSDRFADMRQMELALQRFLYSGVVDPTSAEVRNIFPRIVDAGGEPVARRTSVIEAPSLPPEPSAEKSKPPQPRTERLEDIENLSSTQDDPPTSLAASSSSSSSSSSSDESAVFSTSAKQPRAPGPSAPTMMADDPQALEAAVVSFERQRSSSSQRNLKSRPQGEGSQKNAPSTSPEPSRRNAPAPATVVAEGMLQEEADRVLRTPDEDGTPATRTLVPASQKNLPAPAPSTVTSSSSSPPARVSLPSRKPLFAAAGIVAVAFVIAVAIAFSGGKEPTTLEPPIAQPPIVKTSDPVVPVVAAVVVPVPVPVAEPVIEEPVAVEPVAVKPVAVKPVATPVAKPIEKPIEKPAATDKPGTVYVDVINGWAKVFLGKKPLGETPVTLTFPPGRYNITLESGDGKRKTVPVTVGSGTKSQIRESL
ncbi:MAG: protein kinase [Deltaproteobacteria bacterium]|nr:protein kinase [Deltaproteobacteria bacterium]